MTFSRSMYCVVDIEAIVDRAIEHGFVANEIDEISFSDFIDNDSVSYSDGEYELTVQEIQAVEQACREEFLERYEEKER